MSDMQGSTKSNASPSQNLNKACEPCRALKVRCLPATGGPNPVCQRCLKFDRQCLYAPPHRKKQRKRTDARVAELEKEIMAMRALLEKSHKQELSPATSSRPSLDSPSAATPPPTSLAPHTASQDLSKLDIIGRGLLNIDEARQLLHVYRNEYTPHFPLVSIPPETSVEELRTGSPILFFAIMTTASSKVRPDLYSKLSTEIIQVYVQWIMVDGEKNLEMVKAISITSAWYHPADKWASLKFYEYVHLAATICIDIGLGDRDTYLQFDTAEAKKDAKRTLVACYVQCASISLAVRRPNMMIFSTYMNEITDELDMSPQAGLNDRILGANVRLMNIGVEINNNFNLSDAGREGRMSDERLQQDIAKYTARLTTWKDYYGPGFLVVDLQIVYHFVMLTLHSIPLHQFYQPTLFRPPYVLQAPKQLNGRLSQTACQSLTLACLSAHSMIDVFVGLPVEQIRSFPNHIFARTAYSVIILMAICFLPSNNVGSMYISSTDFFREMTQVDRYFKLVIDKMMEAAGMMEYRIPCVFVGPLMKARKWFLWATERQRRGETIDGGLRFSLFAGPDDHPAVADGCNSDSRSRSETPQTSPNGDGDSLDATTKWDHPVLARHFTTASQSAEPAPTSDKVMADPILSPTDINTTDYDWMKGLEQDYTSMLDPSMFAAEFEFNDMSLAFQDLGTMGIGDQPLAQVQDLQFAVQDMHQP